MTDASRVGDRQIAKYKAEVAKLKKQNEDLCERLLEAELDREDSDAATRDCFRELVARISNPSVRQLPIDLRLLVEEMCAQFDVTLPR